jgi:predicted nucleotidyltransferase
LRAKGVQALYVFGSVARGEAGPGSDVHLLIKVEPAARFSLLDLVGVRHGLEARLGAPADVHLRDGIHYWIRERVPREAVRLF